VPILVVDEAKENLASLEIVLKKSGYQPLTVRNGADILAHLREFDPDRPAENPPGIQPPNSPLQVLECRKAELEERVRVLFENSPTPLMLMGAEGTGVRDMNAAAAHMLGYTDRSLSGVESNAFPDGGNFTRPGMLPGSTTCTETTIRSRSGEIFDVEVTATRLAGSGDSPILLSLSDRTAEKRMHRHLQQVEKMTMMGRMASGIAHEIRNPLAAVMLNLQLLDLAAGDHTGTRQRIAAALEGVNRIEQVVQSTLHLARSTPAPAGRERLHELIERSLWFLRVPLDQRGVRIVREYADGDPVVTVDARQIQQVLLNVLQNAIEASPDGAAVLVRSSRAVTGAGEERILVDVIDAGPGIAPVVLRKLFEPFVTTKTGGTGLGMSISRQIMVHHGGTITVPSTGPGGTTVRLDFPHTHPSSGATHA
jgi:PAS domain S-box-containing protein